MSDNQIVAAQHQETDLERVKNYILSPEVKERFADMMGANGIYYLNQVMILVANSTKLQECEPKSILIAAMRAASLKLSVDPSSGQAWIIPYKGKATFQLGYKGVYELAQRTNLYRYINVIDIYEGEEVTEDRMTGMHSITGMRKAASSKVIGRMLFFELFSGFKKTFYMTCEEIDKHAAKYSQGYQQSGSKWHDPTERPKMERKTVLVNGLRKWGRFNPGDSETLDQIEEDQGYLERLNELPEENEVSERVVEVHTESENMAALGFGEPVKPAAPVIMIDPAVVKAAMTLEQAEATLNAKGETYGSLDTAKLIFMANSLSKIAPDKKTPEQTQKAEAIEIIIKQRDLQP